MIERRIRFAKDKQELVKRFLSSDDGAGPFRLQADVLAFAASLGASRGRREPLPEALGEPIRQEVFDRQGYDTLVNLLAVQAEMSAAVLEDSDEMIARRASIFEEFANGGLSILAEETQRPVEVQPSNFFDGGRHPKRDEVDTPTFDLRDSASDDMRPNSQQCAALPLLEHEECFSQMLQPYCPPRYSQQYRDPMVYPATSVPVKPTLRPKNSCASRSNIRLTALLDASHLTPPIAFSSTVTSVSTPFAVVDGTDPKWCVNSRRFRCALRPLNALLRCVPNSIFWFATKLS